MATTRGHICELVIRQLSGGMPSDDTELTVGLVNQYINAAVGFAVKSNYKDEIQLNGIESVADAFYSSFTGITITLDTATGWYKATLPQQPVGVGTGWDISSFMLVTGSGAKLFAKPIKPTQVPFIYNVSNPPNEILYWITGVDVSLHSCKDLTKYKANVQMISSQSSDLDAPMNIPDAYLPVIIEYIGKTLGVQMQMPVDISSDSVPTPQIK